MATQVTRCAFIYNKCLQKDFQRVTSPRLQALIKKYIYVEREKNANNMQMDLTRTCPFIVFAVIREPAPSLMSTYKPVSPSSSAHFVLVPPADLRDFALGGGVTREVLVGFFSNSFINTLEHVITSNPPKNNERLVIIK